MENQQLKYIKGAVNKGCPADIFFYTDVDCWSVDDFLWELKYLINNEVSKINVHINSAGGTCIDGISVFARLMDCPIPTACYNDGLAASMASVIWAAGQEVYMRDYALLMIHNPFVDSDSGKMYNQVTEAFTQQLKTIYKKRFGMSDEEITAIMDGEGVNDGTFFTSEQAVEKGFVTADHIIETPSALKAKIQSELKANAGINSIKAVMSKYADLPKISSTKAKQNKTNIHLTNKKMNEKEITVIAALFGLTGEKATVEAVSAQISSIKAKAEKYDEIKKSYDKVNEDYNTVKTELEGAKASIKNLNADLAKAKESLEAYEKAEKAAQAKKVASLVENAINECKIDKADKEKWVKMAENDYALAESVLASIPARADISGKIANDNKADAKDDLKDTQAEINARVDAVIGKDFKFRTLD